jgi:hypothetical protein
MPEGAVALFAKMYKNAVVLGYSPRRWRGEYPKNFEIYAF